MVSTARSLVLMQLTLLLEEHDAVVHRRNVDIVLFMLDPDGRCQLSH